MRIEAAARLRNAAPDFAISRVAFESFEFCLYKKSINTQKPKIGRGQLGATTAAGQECGCKSVSQRDGQHNRQIQIE